MKKTKKNPFNEENYPKELIPNDNLIRSDETRDNPQDILDDINEYIVHKTELKNSTGQTIFETCVSICIYFVFLVPVLLVFVNGHYLLSIGLFLIISSLVVTFIKKVSHDDIEKALKRKQDLNLDKFESQKISSLENYKKNNTKESNKIAA